MEERNGMTRSWQNIHVGWKIAGIIFFSGVAYGGYQNLRDDVTELKNNKTKITELQIQVEVLNTRMATMQEQFNKMDNKLDKLLEKR